MSIAAERRAVERDPSVVYNRDTNFSHQIAGGVFCTGRPDLALGVEARATLSTPSPQVSLAVIEVVFGMHYFW